MREFTGKIGHPQKLSEYGVTQANIEKAADMSLSDGSIVNNPRIVFEASEIMNIFTKVL